MNKEMKKIVNTYIKKIKPLLFCSTKTSRVFLSDFKTDIENFVEENNVSFVENIIEEFGTPESVARGFLSRADLNEIKKKVNFKKALLTVASLALIVLLIIAIFDLTK